VRRSPIWAERNGVQLVDDSEDLDDDAKDSDGDRRGRLRVSAMRNQVANRADIFRHQ
jgi:hypothetical protein